MTFNIYESESNFLIQSFLPGLETDTIEVYVESGSLVIEAKRDLNNGKPLLQERSQQDVYKTIQLNGLVEHDAITADYSNGLLQITLPKRAKRIEVKVA